MSDELTHNIHEEAIQPLSMNEKKTLEFIEAYVLANGIAPTFSEIQKSFGFSSLNSVQRYIKQLQTKGYLSSPAGNQKRAITVLRSSSALKDALHSVLAQKQQPHAVSTLQTRAPVEDRPQRELLSLPLLGSVAAGRPIEALNHDEFTEVPPSMVREARRSFTLRVSGRSMIGDGIHDGDILIVQEQAKANNGEICVCSVDGEATVKRFYLHAGAKLAQPQIELRPSNPELESMWYSPDQVAIRGIVVGLLRKF